MRSGKAALVLITTSFIALTGSPCYAEIAVSANDGKMVLENGVATVRKQPLPDTVSIIDLSGAAPHIVAEIRAPASVVGPPPSVAVASDDEIRQQRNLAAQVDNPTDLVQPRGEGPTYTPRRTTVFEKYRRGEESATVYVNPDKGKISDIGAK